MRKNRNKKKSNNKVVNIILIIGIVFLIASLILMLTKNKQVDNHIKDISYEEYSTLVKEDKYQIFLLTTPTCDHCKNYKPYVNYVADDYNLTIYNIDISKLNYDQYMEIHDKYQATKNSYNESGIPMVLTPTTIITKNNEEVTSIVNNIGYDGFLKLLKDNKVIE